MCSSMDGAAAMTSYWTIVGDLRFRIKTPREHFFAEGDVSEIATLIDVDNTFVQMCADLIQDVMLVLQAARPGFIV